MKFFTKKDFVAKYEDMLDAFSWSEIAAKYANERLEREGAVVYTRFKFDTQWSTNKDGNATHKALLINIENFERCLHPPEKIRNIPVLETSDGAITTGSQRFELSCECGQRMKQVTSYEVEK